MKSLILLISLFFLSCSHPGIRFDPSRLPEPAKRYYGSKHALSPRLWMIHQHGLPQQTGCNIVSDWPDLFSQDYPPREEIWLWDSVAAYFESPVEVWWHYLPPENGNGELKVRLLDTCWMQNELCMEFCIDGLQMSQCRTLWKVQLLIQSDDRWWYIYDMSPTVGNKGLRALEATVFVPYETLQKYKKRGSSTVLLLFVFRDFLSAIERVALTQTPLGKGVNKKK